MYSILLGFSPRSLSGKLPAATVPDGSGKTADPVQASSFLKCPCPIVYLQVEHCCLWQVLDVEPTRAELKGLYNIIYLYMNGFKISSWFPRNASSWQEIASLPWDLSREHRNTLPRRWGGGQVCTCKCFRKHVNKYITSIINRCFLRCTYFTPDFPHLCFGKTCHQTGGF